MKTCKDCKVAKSLEGFSPDARMLDGYINSCRECRRKLLIARREKIRKEGPSKKVSEKRCNVCMRIKPSELFNKSSGCLDGLASRCKDCDARKMAVYRKENRPAYNSYMREYNGKTAPYVRYLAEILRRYGCTQDQYEGLLKAQDHTCALCPAKHNDKKRKGRLYVDHCHDSLKIRGLLCHSCNCALGLFKDDTRVLMEAVAYITRNKSSK